MNTTPENPFLSPRTYRRSTYGRRWRTVLAAAFVFAGLSIIVALLLHRREPNKDIPVGAAGVVIAALGAAAYREAQRYQIVLHSDRMEVLGLSSTSIPRNAIAGYQVNRQHNLLVLIGASGKTIKSIEMSFVGDELFDVWFENIPDLDQKDFAGALEEALSADASGQGRAERIDSIVRSIRVSAWVGIASFVLALWGMLYPHPYALVVSANLVVPILLLSASFAFPSKVRFETVVGWSGTDLPIIITCAAVGTRGFFDSSPLSWMEILILSSAFTVALYAIISRLMGASKTKTALSLAVMMSPYPLGAIALGNQWLDRGPAALHAIRLVEKISGTTARDPCYVVAIDFARVDETRRHQVPCSWMANVQVGDALEIEVLEGAFNIPWWRWR